MKKIISLSLILTMFFSVMFSSALSVEAASVKTCFPYTLGEQAEYSYTSTSEYHKFEITKRTKLKVEMFVPQEQESKYNGDVKFSFERRKVGEAEETDSKKYFDFKDEFVVSRGTSEIKEVTLQPGEYYFVAKQGSTKKYTYQFKLSVLEETDTPIHSNVAKNGTSYDVEYEIGTRFNAHNYQYENGKMYFYFSVPYKTQYVLLVNVDKDEYFNNYSYNHYDTIILQRDNNDKYNPYKDVVSYIVGPGETINKSLTLEDGNYRIEMKSNNGRRGDFSLMLTKGSIDATEIQFKDKTTTIERGVSTYIIPETFPDNGTACVSYKSSDESIATVNERGWVTGIKDGKATITATLQNGEQTSIEVIVKEMKAVAEVVDQRKFFAYHNKNEVLLDFTPYKDTYTDAIYISNLDIDKVKRTFKIYRSNKKNGTYKYVGSVSYNKTIGYIEFVDKKVKANTRYYYKTQVKVHGDGDFGPFSKPMEYWTAPNPKVKLKSNSMKKATWKKVKGTTGYLVTEHCIRFVGYNIFGRELRDSITAAKLVKGTSFKKKYYYRSKSGAKSKSDFSVTTYGKHGKYYYVSGKQITKYKGDLEILKVDRLVG